MKNLIAILFCLLPCFSFAQEDSDSIKIAKNTVFVEIFGNGFLYSINYDRILFYKNKAKITARGGFMYVPNWFGWSNYFTIPLEMNLLIGKKHHWG